MLEIHVEETGTYTLCRPVGELDAYTVGQFRESLVELATKPRLLIDLSEVPFMDSAGLGALIGGIRRAREAEGDVSVACSRPDAHPPAAHHRLRSHRAGHRDARRRRRGAAQRRPT